jgi:site-specific recombinase XerD
MMACAQSMVGMTGGGGAHDPHVQGRQGARRGHPPRCSAAVDDYLAARKDPSPALFIGFHSPTTVGKPTENRLTDAGARHVCRQVARRLGLSRFSPPVLRHTLGTLPQGEMGDVRLTAEVFGHSGLGSVAGYTKVAATHLREGYRRMEARGL